MKRIVFLLVISILCLSFVGCGYSEEYLEEVRREAYEEGLDAGYDFGYEEGAREYGAEGYAQGLRDGSERTIEELQKDGEDAFSLYVGFNCPNCKYAIEFQDIEDDIVAYPQGHEWYHDYNGSYELELEYDVWYYDLK